MLSLTFLIVNGALDYFWPARSVSYGADLCSSKPKPMCRATRIGFAVYNFRLEVTCRNALLNNKVHILSAFNLKQCNKSCLTRGVTFESPEN